MPNHRFKRRFLLLGIGIAVCYWLIEAVADSVFGSEGPIVYRLLPADPNEIWMRLIIVALVLGFADYVSSSVERRARTDERLRLLESSVQHANDAVCITTGKLDPPGPEIVYINEAFSQLYGYSGEEAVGRPVSMLVPPECSAEIPGIFREIKRNQKIDHFETVRVTKAGHRVEISLTVSPVKDAEGRIVGTSMIARDITEQKQLHESLRTVREAERYRIACDLHDEVLQDLIDTLYSMQVTRSKSRQKRLEISEIDKQIDYLQKATDSLRDVVNDLCQENIQKQPFLHLLKSVVLVNRQKAPHLKVDLDVDDSFSSGSSGRAGIELLRIIQEALVNVRRHSWARHARVSVREKADLLTAEVVDDGRGFDPQAVLGGVGLSAMQERACKLDGDVDIHSEPGNGTRVTVRIPAASVPAVDASNVPSEI